MDTRRREVKNLNFQPKRTTEELALVLTDITQALRLLAPEANEARNTIEQHTPSIADLARELAEKTRKLEEETKADAKDAEATEDPETKRADIQELQDKQEALMQELSDLTNALRQDANTQDVLSEEGRERARDADDSIAMVKKPADEAEQNIEQASLAQRTDDQVRELEETAQSQEQLAQALEQVAEHYENLDKNPEAVAETRQELRAAEEELGIAQQLEEQFSQVERLAELANLDPEELLAALENELDENRVMQKELSDIAKDFSRMRKSNSKMPLSKKLTFPKTSRIQISRRKTMRVTLLINCANLVRKPARSHAKKSIRRISPLEKHRTLRLPTNLIKFAVILTKLVVKLKTLLAAATLRTSLKPHRI